MEKFVVCDGGYVVELYVIEICVYYIGIIMIN